MQTWQVLLFVSDSVAHVPARKHGMARLLQAFETSIFSTDVLHRFTWRILDIILIGDQRPLIETNKTENQEQYQQRSDLNHIG